METKGIIATTHIDRHGDKIEKEALETLVQAINTQESAIAVSVEHDGLVMPIGKVLKGNLVQLPDGEFAVTTVQEIFDVHSITPKNSDETFYMAGSEQDYRPFADFKIENTDRLTVSFEPNNFTQKDFTEIKNFLLEEDVEIELEVRKSLIPDPEIVFHLIEGTFICLIGKKVVENLADDIAADISSCYRIIKNTILKFAHYSIPANRPKTYRLREQGEYMRELAVRTSDPNVVFEALQPDKLEKIDTLIKGTLGQFNVSPAKVQLLYDAGDKEWKLNYLLTTSGQAIGTEKCYKRTRDLFNSLGHEDGSANVSIAGLNPAVINVVDEDDSK